MERQAMVQIAHGWELDVERGPDWLFVRPHGLSDDPLEVVEAGSPDLADEVWALIEKYFTRRVVLELDQVGELNSYLIGQLVRLHKRVSTQGGLMRLSGLSPANRSVLDECQLSSSLPCYDNRTEAVMATRPAQPR
jgi:anti-anti-sigma factor